MWRDARVVEWGDLEHHYTRKGIGGSNPPPAAASKAIWRGTKVAERDGLENRCSASYRGFESHPLRQDNLVSCRPTSPVFTGLFGLITVQYIKIA